MSNPSHPSPSTATPTLTPSPDTSAAMRRTSSMPDEQRYTARLRRLRDRVPAPRAPIIFTGASSSKMNLRVSRLTPPKGTPVVKPKCTQSPGYYGGDARKYEKRTQRYRDGKNVLAKNGGAPVFSGSCGTIYLTRMMRLQDRH